MFSCSSGGSGIQIVYDTEAPTTPSHVRTVIESSDTVTLSWNHSTDNVAVAGYRIYKDDALHATTARNTVSLTGLAPQSLHCFKVTAFDLSGNESQTGLNTCANTGALGPEGNDPTENWNKFARYGDFLSAQIKSLRKFGYGIFITRMQAADGPVCSTFWLYSDAPAPGAMPEIRQMWRWNEFDFEFVPYTQATQNSYITLDGSFPRPAVTYYGSELDWNNPLSQQIKPAAVNWVEGRYMTDDTVFADMQHFYNKWMVTDPKIQIAQKDFSFQGAIDTTGPPHITGSLVNTSESKPGWTFADDWKYPLTAVKPVPAGMDIKKMATINWWRMPRGNQSIAVDLPGYAQQNFSYIVKNNKLDGSTAAHSNTAAVLNNETYVFPKTDMYNPYTSLNTYTIVWTKKRVAFYINAGSDGRDIVGSTPVAVFTPDQYPSIVDSGTQAPQGNITWADTTLADPLGQVSINLANYVAFKAAKNYALTDDPHNPLPLCGASQTCPTNANLPAGQQAGAGWSGLPPGDSWEGADAYVRSVEYYPLTDADVDGSQNEHFDFNSTGKWIFDLGDGTWTTDNFKQKISRYFGILYAQDYTKDDITITMKPNGIDVDKISGTLVDSKSPLAVNFISNDEGTVFADRKPLMKLSCRPSDKSPVRKFFFIGTAMDTGKAINDSNPFLFATIDTDGTGNAVLGVSGTSTPLSFFAPPAGKSVNATIKLYSSITYRGSFPPGKVPSVPDKTAVIRLQTSASGTISWSFVSGDSIVSDFQEKNPHLITIKMP